MDTIVQLKNWRATRKATLHFSAPNRDRQLHGKTVRHVYPVAISKLGQDFVFASAAYRAH